MTLQTVYLESSSGLAAGNPIANLIPGSWLFRVRRLMIGVRTVSATPVDQLLTVAFTPAAARGTNTSNLSFGTLDNEAASNPAGASVDVAWSTFPTFDTGVESQSYGIPLTTHHPADVRWTREEAMVRYSFATDGLVLWNVGNALPADHLYTVTITVEE